MLINIRSYFSFAIAILTTFCVVLGAADDVAVEPVAAPVTFPDGDDWSMDDIRQAAKYITQLAEQDPLSLPREGENSDDFKLLIDNMKRVVDVIDSFEFEVWQANYRELSSGHEAFGTDVIWPIFNAYSVPKDQFNVKYEREMLLLLPITTKYLSVNIKTLRLFAGDRLNESPESWPEGSVDQLTRLSKVSGSTGNAIINLLIRPGQRHPELRTAMLTCCEDSLTQLLWAMNQADRDLAGGKLKFLKTMTDEPSDLAVLDKLINAERQPLQDLEVEPAP